ncbi:MAG: phosphodiester glycosidase family protein [Cyclobacteriaceae bacterium]
MKKYLIIISFGFIQYSYGQEGQEQITWTQETISESIGWKTLHSDVYFDSWQNINVLIFESGNEYLKFSFISDTIRRKTSEMATEARAAFALNGSFFNMKTAEPACFLKINDTILSKTANEIKRLDDAALVISKTRNLEIMLKPENGWQSLGDTYPDVMVTGPLLVWDGKMNTLEDNTFNTTRHPRTGVCITKTDQVIFFTADGRHEQAVGLSTSEFAEFMLSMECKQGINLDGGGSTTLWSARHGILNRPSDNKLFDNHGEREVANIVVVFLEQN